MRDLFDRLPRFSAMMPDGDLCFQDAATLRQAVCAGLGVGLLPEIDAAEDLKSGQRVAPLGLKTMQDMAEEDVPGFYLVLPKAHRTVKANNMFCCWRQSENWAIRQSTE